MSLTPNQTIESLAPYVLANLSVPQDKELISLAQNELCFSPSKHVIEATNNTLQNMQLYPDPTWSELVASIATVHNLKRNQILCGAGSMELLEVLGRIYLSSVDRVLMSEYGYSFFKTVVQMYGATVDLASEINFTASVDLLLEQVKPETKIVFIANPGNPTGTLVSSDEVRRLRRELPDDILLIVDEAYAEFVDLENHTALFDLVEHGNTIVLRTFSKIYGLAGMRVGWGYFPDVIYSSMRKVLNPNNISAASQAAACAAIQDQQTVQSRRNEIRLIRETFTVQLNQLDLNVAQSHSNFILIDFSSKELAQICFTKLREQGILMRPMGVYGLTHCLRATISNKNHMDFTIEHLTRIVEENRL